MAYKNLWTLTLSPARLQSRLSSILVFHLEPFLASIWIRPFPTLRYFLCKICEIWLLSEKEKNKFKLKFWIIFIASKRTDLLFVFLQQKLEWFRHKEQDHHKNRRHYQLHYRLIDAAQIVSEEKWDDESCIKVRIIKRKEGTSNTEIGIWIKINYTVAIT